MVDRRVARKIKRAVKDVKGWPPPGHSGDDRFGLRLLAAGDRDAFFVSIDHDVRHHQGYTAESMRNYLSMFRVLERFPGVDLPAQLIVVEYEGRFGGIYFVDRAPAKTADIQLGWWLAPQARTKGLGQASLAAVLDHVHEGIGAKVACMGTATDNLRAIRQIEAVGAVLDAERPHTLPDGRTIEGRWYHHTAD